MPVNTTSARWRTAATLALAGGLHALAFAPDPLPSWALALIQVLALAVLARSTRDAQRGWHAFARGWWFGLVSFGIGLYWLFISMHQYGGLSAPLAVAGVVALSAFLAMFGGFAGLLSVWLRPLGKPASPLAWALTWAAAWAGLEWLRSVLFSGFPWLNIGYAHVDSPLAGWAPLLGVHGMALLAALAAAALASIPVPPAGRLRPALPLLATALALAAAGWPLARIAWSTPEGKPMNMRLVQGNIGQSQKFDPALLEEGIIGHMRLAVQAPAAGEPAADLIILPETVLPLFQDQLDPQVWETWRKLAARQDSAIAMGVPLHTVEADGSQRYTNSAIGFDADTPFEQIAAGTMPQRYDKRHLVPWGEYVPPGFGWFVQMLNIPLGEFDRGPVRQQPFDIRGRHLAFNICYEDLFGPELLPAILPGPNGEPGATILVNLSNLGWFGESWALRQHLQIGRLRSMETARPMVTVTNTGITASIDAKGRVGAMLAPHTAGVLPVTVQGMTGLTPYARYGDAPLLLLTGALLIVAAARRGRERR